MDVATQMFYTQHQKLSLREEASNLWNYRRLMVPSGGDANVTAKLDVF